MAATQGTSMVGQTLSNYHLIEQIQQGGMEEAYLAEDTIRNRRVVLYIFPSALRRDPERINRIRADVEAAIRINHPNIVRIYSMEQAKSSTGVSLVFITMEYVEGEPLSEVLPAEGMPVKEMLALFMPLADALFQSHKLKAIHRDIKPSNIIITSNNVPKIIDFGLARLSRQDLDVRDSQSHTRSVDVLRSLMQSGTILDAISYMSPEQAEGRSTNERTDIFSFGTVLYEAATGDRPFRGESYVDLVSSIMRDEPPWVNSVKPELPYNLAQLIDMCLKKDIRERYLSMDKVKGDLESIQKEIEPPKTVAPPMVSRQDIELMEEVYPLHTPASPEPSSVKKTYILASAMFLAGALIASLIHYFGSSSPTPVSRKLPISMTVSLPVGGQGSWTTAPVISPDGDKIIYLKDNGLWIRDFSEVDPYAVPNTMDGERVFWSSDGETIGFFVQNDTTMEWTLQTSDIHGESRTIVCALPPQVIPRGATWYKDNEIILSLAGGQRQGGGLFMVPASGGQPKPFLTPDATQGETGYIFPKAMPDGASLLFAITTKNSIGRIAFQPDGAEKYTEIISQPDDVMAHPSYSNAGYVLYQRGSAEAAALWAVPFDGTARTGDPVLVADHGDSPSLALNDMLVYNLITSDNEDQLVWVNRNGHISGIIGQSQSRIDNPVISPDGHRVAVTGTERGNADIWVHEGYMGEKTRLTVDPGYDYSPVWSPDGTQIAFSSVRKVSADIFILKVDGTALVRSLLDTRKSEWVAHWSLDGRFLMFEVDDPVSKRDLWYLPMYGNNTPSVFLKTPAQEYYPVLSPDGKFVAYQSDESGVPQIYVSRFPSAKDKFRISNKKGTAPRWSERSNELFFVEGRHLMVASMENINVVKPEILFNADEIGIRLLGEYQEPAYDVAPDGHRIVAVQRRKMASTILAENWDQDIIK